MYIGDNSAKKRPENGWKPRKNVQFTSSIVHLGRFFPICCATSEEFSPFVALAWSVAQYMGKILHLLRNIWGKFSICYATFEENSSFVAQQMEKTDKTVKNRCSSRVCSPFLTSTSPLCTKNANSAKKIGSAALFFPLEHCFKSSARYRGFPPPAV